MKYLFIFLVLVLISCKPSVEKKEAITESSSQTQEEEFIDLPADTLKGMYIGDFGGSDIRIVLNYVSSNHAVGYNIHKGLQRNISGKVEETATEYLLELSEPGDNEFDGVFHLTFSKVDLSCLGVWESYSTKVGKKKFTLEKFESKNLDIDVSELKLTDLDQFNFTSVFNHCSDSISDIYFDADGLVRYEFYPEVDLKERKEQVKVVKGTWSYKPGVVSVSWQANTIFKEKKSIFNIHVEQNYEFYLVYNTRKLYPNFIGY